MRLACGATPEIVRVSLMPDGPVTTASTWLPATVLAVWLPCPSASNGPSPEKSQAPMSLSLQANRSSYWSVLAGSQIPRYTPSPSGFVCSYPSPPSSTGTVPAKDGFDGLYRSAPGDEPRLITEALSPPRGGGGAGDLRGFEGGARLTGTALGGGAGARRWDKAQRERTRGDEDKKPRSQRGHGLTHLWEKTPPGLPE